MAGQADRSAAGQTGPVSRRPAAGRKRSSADAPKMNSIGVPISSDEVPLLPGSSERLAVAVPLAPDHQPREVKTQATYRLLVSRGLPGVDAAALIGYAVGLRSGESRWNLKQINRLLFLRNLYSKTEWGESEREPA